MRKHMHGITLTELMIVILVLGIIVAVAYPNYREFAARAKRNEAKAALLQIATNQERFYLNNQTYTCELRFLGFNVGAGVTKVVTETGSYQVACTFADANMYKADASFLLGGSEAGKCGIFTIESTGLKGSGPYTDCWSRTR